MKRTAWCTISKPHKKSRVCHCVAMCALFRADAARNTHAASERGVWQRRGDLEKDGFRLFHQFEGVDPYVDFLAG